MSQNYDDINNRNWKLLSRNEPADDFWERGRLGFATLEDKPAWVFEPKALVDKRAGAGAC